MFSIHSCEGLTWLTHSSAQQRLCRSTDWETHSHISKTHKQVSFSQQNNNAIAPRASQQDLCADCKTRNFVAQFAQINRAQFQNVNKKKILVLNPSSRVGFEGPFKTASSELKKILAEGIKIYLIVFWVKINNITFLQLRGCKAFVNTFKNFESR